MEIHATIITCPIPGFPTHSANGLDIIKIITKISNFLLKLHIDLRKVFFKQILDKFGGKLRIVLYGAASLDKETIVGLNNFGINSIHSSSP